MDFGNISLFLSLSLSLSLCVCVSSLHLVSPNAPCIAPRVRIHTHAYQRFSHLPSSGTSYCLWTDATKQREHSRAKRAGNCRCGRVLRYADRQPRGSTLDPCSHPTLRYLEMVCGAISRRSYTKRYANVYFKRFTHAVRVKTRHAHINASSFSMTTYLSSSMHNTSQH